jgi:hypothetical protein
MVFFPWARCEDLNPGQNFTDTYFNYSLYSKTLACALPSKVTETVYAEGRPMEPVTTTYAYNDGNYQPSGIEKTVSLSDSQLETCLTRFWYPEDDCAASSNTACLTNAHCVSEQVKAEKYINGKTVCGYRNVYKSLPTGLPVVSKSYSTDSSGKETLELEVEGTDGYDGYGNIREYRKTDMTPVTIIWSYSHQVPVMEIIGMTYSEVKGISANVARLEEATLASDIKGMTESLHAALLARNVHATAYLYSPWYTVSQVIMPNGEKTRYGYDGYGRLEKVTDHYSRTLQKYFYNYETK